MRADVPQHVLPETVADAVGDRTVTAAVFVTFQFEPGFFEDAVLAAILGCESGHGDRVQRALLEDRLHELDVVVFYDRAGLIVDRTPRQAISAVPVSWKHHVLHAKHVLLLVRDGTQQSLLLVTTSANLTRSGWWENVEIADLEEVAAGVATPLKSDLVELLGVLRGLDPSSRHVGLEDIARFVGGLSQGSGFPRLWTGQQPLPEFLGTTVGTTLRRVELVAPFVGGDAQPVRALHDALRPEQIWLRFPVDRDGAPAATEAWREEVAETDAARFAELPKSVDLSLGKGASGKRFVHAKLVRMLSADGRAWLLAGSPNLTKPAFAGRERGNLETAILREVPGEPDWLCPTETQPRGAPQPVDPPEGRPWTLLRIRLRYDWKAACASYLLEEGQPPVEVAIMRAGHGSGVAFTILAEPTGDWRDLPVALSQWLRTELASSNVIRVQTGDKEPMPLLVEEIGRLARPDFLHEALTPADILRYWSLRDPASREAHLEELAKRAEGEGTKPVGGPLGERHTMFDSFAGLFHAFLCLRARLDEMIDRGRDNAVVARLLGKGHDALPTLLEKVSHAAPDEEPDHVLQLLTLLSAQEVVEHVERRRPDLLAAHPDERAALRAQLSRLEEVWSELAFDGGSIDPAAFRDWYTTSWSTAVGGEAK